MDKRVKVGIVTGGFWVDLVVKGVKKGVNVSFREKIKIVGMR